MRIKSFALGARRRGGWLRVLLLAAAGMLASRAADARRVFWQESPGVWKSVDEKELASRKGPRGSQFTTNMITWGVTYVDQVMGSGVGFDDPVDGPDRRAIAVLALQYINNVLNYSGLTLDIEFKASQLDGANYIATAGTYYFGGPPGFTNGVAYEHASTGIDPIPGSSNMGEDIFCTVDFGFNLHDDPALTAPTPLQLDLFSVLVHEMTHGLGFSSLTNSSGVSPIGTNVYSRLNDFQVRGNGFDLFSATGPNFFKGTPADLVSMDVFFSGPQASGAYGSRPPSDARNPYVQGTSMSHWAPGIVGGGIMVPALGYGQTNRTYKPADLGALRDIGWNLVGTPFPTLTPTPAPNRAVDWDIYQ